MKNKFFAILFAILLSGELSATTEVYDFTTMNLSQSDMSITNGSVSYNSSKGHYEVSNNANDTLSMTINGVPNVEFKYWAETSKKAFKVKSNDYIQLDGATRTLRITNLNINDVVTLRVASKGPSEANSFSGGLTNCTLYSGNLTQAEYDYPFVYEDVSFKAAASTIEITNTAGGYCLTTISIERSQSSDPQHSGTCGPNLTWTLIEDVLIISGSGNMYDYTWDNHYPWYSYRQSITSVAIGNSVTSIGNHAFEDCSSLTSITIPNSVTSIGEWAFLRCSNLTSITIPNSVTSIGGGAFDGCSGLTSISVESGNTHYDSRNNCNALIETTSNTLIAGCKNTIIPNDVTSIGNSAFYGCRGLTSITIPNSVTSIGDEAFRGCSALTSVTISNSVTSIGISAFYGCSSLTSITIPNSVTSIGGWAFSYCSGLTSVTIGNSVTSIGGGAFDGCSGLRSVVLGSSLRVIEDPGFCGCDSIESFTCYSIRPPSVVERGCTYSLPDSTIVYAPAEALSAYQAHDFWGRYDVRPIGVYDNWTLENGVLTLSGEGEMPDWEETELPWYSQRSTIHRVIVNEGLTNLGSYALHGCYHVDSISLPTTLERFDYMSVAECLSLRHIILPISLREIGDRAFENCRSLQSVTFQGNALQTIGNWAFYNAHALRNITIPAGVTSIGDGAFYGCNYLTNLSIPASVSQIGDYGFALCNRLQVMYVDAVVPPMVATETFTDVSRSIPVYVPDVSVADYQATPIWREFNIVGQSQSGTSLDVINSTTTQPVKVIENGQLYILLPDGTRYDATGKKVE